MNGPPPLPPTTVGYATPGVAAPSRRIVSVTTLVACYALVVPPLVLVAMFAARFEDIFRDFGVRLPWLTEVFLAVSRWIRDDYGFVVLLVLPLIPAFVVPLVIRRRETAEQRVIRWGVVLLILLLGYMLLVLVSALAVMLPMVTLIQSVSGQ